jgi:hypothetical protein
VVVGDLDLTALYVALDGRRRERGISWQRLARGVNHGGTYRAVAPSTIRGLASKRLTTCLGRAAASFTHTEVVHRATAP